MNMPGFNHVPGRTDFFGAAAAQLLRLAVRASEAKLPLTILPIGTSTNIAQAFDVAKNDGSLHAFVKEIKLIYQPLTESLVLRCSRFGGWRIRR
jgi:hypothetical protein